LNRTALSEQAFKGVLKMERNATIITLTDSDFEEANLQIPNIDQWYQIVKSLQKNYDVGFMDTLREAAKEAGVEDV